MLEKYAPEIDAADGRGDDAVGVIESDQPFAPIQKAKYALVGSAKRKVVKHAGRRG